MLKIGAFHKRNGWNGSQDFEITKGMTVSEAMLSTGMGNIGLEFVEDICNVPVGSGKTVQVKVTDKKSMWLTRVPWNENGVQNLDRKVSWYNGLTNMEYARILDPLTDKYQLEMVGMGGTRGEYIIFQFDMGDFSVDRDPNGGHTSLLTIAENRKTGDKYFGTDIMRIWCENQFANGRFKDQKAMPAGQDAALVLEFQIMVEQARIDQIRQLNDLFTKPVTKTAIKEVAEALFPTPKPRRVISDVAFAIANGKDMDTDDEATQNMNRKEREAVRDYQAALRRNEEKEAEFNDLFVKYEDELGDNMYALWNTATHWTSHTDTIKSKPEQRELNRLFGGTGKALQNAWAVVNG